MAVGNVLQRETYFDTLSTFHNLYFITLTWVKKFSQHVHFYQNLFFFTSICTSAQVKRVYLYHLYWRLKYSLSSKQQMDSTWTFFQSFVPVISSIQKLLGYSFLNQTSSFTCLYTSRFALFPRMPWLSISLVGPQSTSTSWLSTGLSANRAKAPSWCGVTCSTFAACPTSAGPCSCVKTSWFPSTRSQVSRCRALVRSQWGP